MSDKEDLPKLYSQMETAQAYVQFRQHYPTALYQVIADNIQRLRETGVDGFSGKSIPSQHIYSGFDVSAFIRPSSPIDTSKPALSSQTPHLTKVRALDLACATGIVATALAQPPVNAEHVLGLDIAENMITVARKHAHDQPSVSFDIGSATDFEEQARAHGLEEVDLVTVGAAFHWYVLV
jgi:2-polyprenyl-3-methyl-5-hydroxy-6-metoxy-1,4-benzoquinol methylase